MSDESTPGATPVLAVLDAAGARRWAVVCRAALAAHRGELDALNVFPVPDADTGTNLYLTFDTALERTWAGAQSVGSLPGAIEDLARAMLLSARGNSGVILSQVFRGLADEVLGRPVVDLPHAEHPPVEALDGPALARGLRRASDLAWRSVFRPREGTILSVAESAARAAGEAVEARTSELLEVVRAALAGAREALARTPDQLAELARAGVVDAGGAGFVLLLEALARVVAGERAGEPETQPLLTEAGLARTTHPSPNPDGAVGPQYEITYLLDSSTPAATEQLSERLAALGDSVLVVGGQEGTWSVHAHVDDVGAAVEAGVEAGRPHRVRVSRFADETGGGTANAPHGPAPARSAVVAAIGGAGLVDAYRRAGASVVPVRPRQRVAVSRLVQAVASAGRQVVLLTVDPELAALAQAAAGEVTAVDPGATVRVLSLSSPVQGLAALAVFDPSAPPQSAAEAMSAAARATGHGSVTVAGESARVGATSWPAGAVLGLAGDEVVVAGESPEQVGAAVLSRLLDQAGGPVELVTLVAGRHLPQESLARLVATASAEGVRVSTLPGGRDDHLLLLGVE